MGRVTLVTAIRQMSGKHHAHGCSECHLRYTDACSTPEQNGKCVTCRVGQQRALWDQNSDPAGCCVNAREVKDAETLGKYKLAGPGPWYRCPVCSRTHAHDPRRAHE